jgi:fumarate hydratase class II
LIEETASGGLVFGPPILLGGAGGYLEMNVYKPLLICKIAHSITIVTGGCTNLRKFLPEGTRPNLKKIKEYIERSLILVTVRSPGIGYDKASKIAQYATTVSRSRKRRSSLAWSASRSSIGSSILPN